jgi:uncharacterized membrane-anchored protein YitT (DUF2179 family)
MRKVLITYIWLFIGAILQGLAMSLFLFPHDVPSGGAAGLAILVNHFTHLPLGTSLWIVNFFFLTLALKYFGYAWTLRTMFSVTVTSITVSLIQAYLIIPHDFLFVDLLMGSIIFGTGVGILIRNGASSGGMVIPALMIATYKNWRPGKVMFGVNFSIFLLTAFVIDLRIVIYAVICQWISTKIIDFIFHYNFSLHPPFFSMAERKK